MARPRLKIDPAQVEALARIHCTHEEMAAVLGCSTDTLTRRFADVIEKGRDQGKASLRRKQFELAMKGDRTMLVWLGKQVLGQRDKQEHEHAGPDGGPIAHTVAVRFVRADGAPTERPAKAPARKPAAKNAAKRGKAR